MSKRYGRNQKRRHREEIANLRREREYLQSTASSCAIELTEARGTINGMVEIIESVCENSVALRPKQVAVDGVGSGINWPVSLYGDVVPHSGLETVRLVALRLYIDEHRHVFRRAIHLDCAERNGRAVYVVSEDALRSMPEHIVKNRFSQEIAYRLGESLKKG